MKRLTLLLLCLFWSFSSFAVEPLSIPELTESNFPEVDNIFIFKDATNRLPLADYSFGCEDAAGCLNQEQEFVTAITLPPGTSGLSVGSTGSYHAQCGVSESGCLYFGFGDSLPLEYQVFTSAISETLYDDDPITETRTMYFSIRNNTNGPIFISSLAFNYIIGDMELYTAWRDSDPWVEPTIAEQPDIDNEQPDTGDASYFDGFQNGVIFCQQHPQNCSIKAELDDNGSTAEGIALCQDDPRACGINVDAPSVCEAIPAVFDAEESRLTIPLLHAAEDKENYYSMDLLLEPDLFPTMFKVESIEPIALDTEE